MALAERVYSISYFKTERLVELTWLPGTQHMTDQDFKEALCVFAEGALQHRASRRSYCWMEGLMALTECIYSINYFKAES